MSETPEQTTHCERCTYPADPILDEDSETVYELCIDGEQHGVVYQHSAEVLETLRLELENDGGALNTWTVCVRTMTPFALAHLEEFNGW